MSTQLRQLVSAQLGFYTLRWGGGAEWLPLMAVADDSVPQHYVQVFIWYTGTDRTLQNKI